MPQPVREKIPTIMMAFLIFAMAVIAHAIEESLEIDWRGTSDLAKLTMYATLAIWGFLIPIIMKYKKGTSWIGNSLMTACVLILGAVLSERIDRALDINPNIVNLWGSEVIWLMYGMFANVLVTDNTNNKAIDPQT